MDERYHFPDCVAQHGDDLVDDFGEVAAADEVVEVDLDLAERRVNVQKPALTLDKKPRDQ